MSKYVYIQYYELVKDIWQEWDSLFRAVRIEKKLSCLTRLLSCPITLAPNTEWSARRGHVISGPGSSVSGYLIFFEQRVHPGPGESGHSAGFFDVLLGECHQFF
jgi:hypothetical protein